MTKGKNEGKDCASQVFLAKNTTFLNENFPFVATTFVSLFKINSSEIMANYANLKVRQSATERSIVDCLPVTLPTKYFAHRLLPPSTLPANILPMSILPMKYFACKVLPMSILPVVFCQSV